MADKSENPQDQARMRDLERSLEGTLDDLSSELRQAQDLNAQADADRQRAKDDRSAARKEKEARSVRNPRPGGTAKEGIPVEEIERQSKAINENVAAEERLAQAQRGRARATIDAAESVKRARADEYLRNVPGMGGPAPGRPAPGPAAQQAAEVAARVEAVRRAEEQARFNQYPVPIGPQPRGTSQFAKPIGPISPQAVKDAGLAAAKLAEAEDTLLQRSIRAVPATQELNGALAEQARALGLADNAYTRHGYLTSEFISAAARGEVTFRELGTQVGGTIAKFAGWTAAATSVYGVVAAMNALYHGALQSASGVGLVSRVTTKELPGGNDALQQQFRDLARQFNTPMEDVTQAVYGAAKATSGDLPAALQVAQQALFGVKVGELSAADSTRYLQAIMRGFGADAAELPAIFDAINQAQNRFGGSTGDMIAGVAKAAGIFRLAGGDYRTLIALLTTGTKLTGASATEVATAVSRSASRVLTPQGADALRGVGLDPTQNYSKILAQASAKAQHSSQAEVNQIARALVPQGGQYARILAPILQNRDLYNQVFKQLDPDAARGSAERELRKALQQPDEQLKRLVVDLERLGSTLAQAGGLNLLVGLVKLLDTGLDLTVRLVDAFNAFTPGPLRQVLTPLLELAVLMRTLRRFDVGDSLPAGRGAGAYSTFRESLRRSPDARANAQITQGLGDHERYLEETRRRTAQRAADATFQAERQAARRDQAQARFQAAPLGTAARTQARDQLVAAETLYQSRVVDMQRHVADQVDLADRTVVVQRQLTDYERLRKSGLESEAAAARAGIQFTNPTLNRPVPMQPVPIGGATPGGLIVPAGFSPAAAAVQREEAAVAAAGARASYAGRAAASTTRALRSTMATVTSGIGSAVEGLTRLGSSTIHGLDAVFIGIPAALLIWNQIQKQVEGSQAEVDKLRSSGGGPEGMQARVDEYRRQNADRRVTDPLLRPGRVFRELSSGFAQLGNMALPFGSPLIDHKAQEEEAARQAQAQAESLRRAQSKGALLYLPAIQANFKRAISASQTPAEIQAAIETGLRQVEHGYAKTFGDKRAREAAARVKAEFQAQAAELAAARGDLGEAQRQVTDLASLKVFTGRVGTSFGLQGATTGNLRAAAFGIQSAREQIGADPTKAAEALTQLNALQSTVQQQVNDTLNRLLPLAKSPAAAAQARAGAVEQLKQGLTSGLQSRRDALASSVTVTDDAITRLQAQIASGQGGRGAEAQLRALQARLRSRQNRLGQVEEGLKQENQVVEDFQAQQQRAQFQLEQGVFDATTGRRAAQIHDPVQALRFQLRRSRSRLDDIAKEYGTQSTEYQQALTQELQLQDQIVAAELSKIQTRAALRAARTADPVMQARLTLDGTNRGLAELARRGRQQTEQYQQLLISKAQQQQQLVQAQIGSFQSAQALNRARANVGSDQGAQLQGGLADAQNFVGYLQSLGKQVSPDQMNQALTAVAQAQGAIADYVEQQAQALVQARAEFAKSRTTDPIAQARIDLRAAQQAVQFAKTPAERLSALAAVNNAKRNVHDVKLQNAEDDIDFEREMNQIGVATAIDRYRALLRDKELSKAARREIKRKINALQNDKSGDQSFNIDPTSIRLPTPYEVFRAIKEGANAQQSANLRGAVQNTNHITIQVADQTDVQKVADVFDQYLDTSAASSLRAMGVA